LLRVFDAQIHAARAMLVAKGLTKRGLMRELLTGTRRFAGFRAHTWRMERLSRVLHESRVSASTGSTARKVTIKLYGKGVVPKRDTRPGSENTKYYRRSAGRFIYSKLDFLNGAFGIVPPELDGYESTLDLPAFDVSSSVNPRWLLHLLSWPGFYKRHVGLANGGRKARRVNPAQLLRVSIELPQREEQDEVAHLLDAVDFEIELMGKLAAAYDRQKRAVLDKLLSGEIAIPVP